MADPVIPRIGEASAGDGLAPRRQPTITVNPKPLRDVVKAEYVGGCRYTGYVHKSIRLTHTLRPFAVAMAGDGEFDPWKD